MNGVLASDASAKNASNTAMQDGGVFHYSNESGAPVFTLNITMPAEVTYSTPDLLPPTEKSQPDGDASHILAYVLVPLGSLVVIAALSFLVRISKLNYE